MGLPAKMDLSRVTSDVLAAKSYDHLSVLMLLDLTSFLASPFILKLSALCLLSLLCQDSPVSSDVLL